MRPLSFDSRRGTLRALNKGEILTGKVNEMENTTVDRHTHRKCGTIYLAGEIWEEVQCGKPAVAVMHADTRFAYPLCWDCLKGIKDRKGIKMMEG